MTEEQATPWYRDERLLFAVMGLLLISTLLWRGLQRDTPTPPQPVETTPATPRPVTVAPTGLSEDSPEAVDYFLSVAFGSEHGNARPLIHKWLDDIRVRVSGSPTEDDMATLRLVIDELNQSQSAVNLTLDRFGANMVVYFVPERDFAEIEPNYQAFNQGYFWVRWSDFEIYRARVLLDAEGLSQADRNSLIREEMTQAMGLMNVSSQYSDSIFNDYEDHYVPVFAAIDRLLIQMLYRPDILPGMSREEVINILYGVPHGAEG